MTSSRIRLRSVAGHVAAGAVCVFLLNGCDLTKNQLTYDRAAEADRQDFRDALAPVQLPAEEKIADMPDFQSVVATPEDLKLPSPLVTVSVNRTVSLRDLLFELAEQADVDIELDPQIRGSIIFSAKERPFNQVIDRICEMSGLRYTLSQDNVLRVELDRPYIKNYEVDYMNVTRTSTSTISTSVSMSDSGGGGGGGGGGASGSSLSTSAGGDVWDDLTKGLEQILTSSDTATSLATLADPVATAVNPTPATDPSSGSAPPSLPGSPGVAPMAATAAPSISIADAPEPLVPNAPATYSLSKTTGILSVFANQRQHKMVDKFLKDFRKRSTTQVLIEAKILQVDLTDEFATGIDWAKFNITGLSNFKTGFPLPELTPTATGAFTGVLNFGNLDATINAISRFGTVRALSSPRVTVINNQPASVNVSQNRVYFEFDVQTEDDSTSNEKTVTIDSEQKSVPEGVFLNVVPTANPDTGEIQLVVRPTVSKITSYVTDPTIGLTLAINNIANADSFPSNLVPEVAIQEVDSILKMQSGQMMVMGGLMKDANTVSQSGVPILSDIPYLGYAFKNHSDNAQKSELVVLLKATIVPNSQNADDMDRKIYEKFGEDRRPSRL